MGGEISTRHRRFQILQHTTTIRTDATTGAYAKPVEQARELRLPGDKEGTRRNVLRKKPPMCVSAEDVTFAFEVLEIALGEA